MHHLIIKKKLQTLNETSQLYSYRYKTVGLFGGLTLDLQPQYGTLVEYSRYYYNVIVLMTYSALTPYRAAIYSRPCHATYTSMLRYSLSCCKCSRSAGLVFMIVGITLTCSLATIAFFLNAVFIHSRSSFFFFLRVVSGRGLFILDNDVKPLC